MSHYADVLTSRLAILILLVATTAGISGQQLSREYIYAGGRVIAIERPLASVTVTVDPATFTVPSGGTVSFTAAVSGGGSVTWTVTPATAGSISSSGLFTAATGLTSTVNATVRATSDADPTKYGEASGTVTVVPEQVCSLGAGSASVPNAGGTITATVNCPAGVEWSASSPASWVTFSPSSGTGPTNIGIIVESYGPGTGSRAATLTIAGQPFNLTQQAASTVAVTPQSVELNHGQYQRFTATVDGAPGDGLVTWSVSGVGTIDSGGNYYAPDIILPSQTVATVIASYPQGNGSATATVYLTPYAPPDTLAVSPNSGSQLNQVFTFTVGDPLGASAISRVEVNFNSAIDQFYYGCYLDVDTTTAPGFGETARLSADGAGWSSPVALGTAGSLENAECKLDAGASSITRSGNFVYITLALRFKPGFIGAKGIYMLARNTSGAQTPWVQAGSWDLSANVPALPPSLTLETPAAGATVLGDVTISGWAIDNVTQAENAISGVEVFVDGQSQGGATYGVSRTDVCTSTGGSYPGRPGCPNVGFQFNWNTRNWLNGTHTVRVVAFDTDNPFKTAEVTRTVTVNNPPLPPLVISPSPAWVRMRYSASSTLPIEQQQFTGKVGGAPVSDVNWSLSPPPSAATGTLSATGLYTAPVMGNNSVGANLTLSGVRQSNPAQASSATITLMGVLQPEPIYINTRGQRVWFYASGSLTGYTVTPQVGTIDQYGWYTAPSYKYTGTIRVSARSTSNPNAKYVTDAQLIVP